MLLKNLLTHFFGAVTMATIMHRFFFKKNLMLLKLPSYSLFWGCYYGYYRNQIGFFLRVEKTYAFKKPSYSLFWGCYYGYYYA